MPADAIIFHQEDIVKQERENLDEKNYGCFYLCPSLDFPDVFHARKSQCGQKIFLPVAVDVNVIAVFVRIVIV